MSRLQKKCFIASATLHSLLLLLLFVTPAFLTPENRFEELPIISFIPSKLIDEPFVSGGSPEAAPPPPIEPEPLPLPPQPEPIKTVKPVEPQPAKSKPDPAPVTRNDPPKPVPPKVTISTKLSQRPKDAAAVRANADAQAQAKRRELEQRMAQFNRTLQNLRQGLSSSTSIDSPGPGGEAYMFYDAAIKAIYEREWNPTDVPENDSNVKVKITIRRDGRVIAHEITRRSGNPALDNSVQRVLERVKQVPPFPRGAKEAQRDFNINFNLKAKRQTG